LALVWTDDLALGVDALDAQQRELFMRTNLLLRAAEGPPGDHESTQLLAFLTGHVGQHFEDEERLMAALDYPEAAAHRAEHHEFRAVLRDLVRELALGGVGARLRQRIQVEVCAWIEHHVQESDRALAAFARSPRRPPRLRIVRRDE
jgi:hemerythrin